MVIDFVAQCQDGSLDQVPKDLLDIMRSWRDLRGNTLLHISQSPKTLKALVYAGLDPNARNKAGLTPLMIYPRDVECLGILITAGANPNLKTPSGHSALRLQAISEGCGFVGPDYKSLQYLIDEGAKPPTPAEVMAWGLDAQKMVSSGLESALAHGLIEWLTVAAPSASARKHKRRRKK